MVTIAVNSTEIEIIWEGNCLTSSLQSVHNELLFGIAINYNGICKSYCVLMSGMQACLGSLGGLRSLG